MILKQFFDYYFKAINPDVANLYQSMLPEKNDLALAYSNMLVNHDEEALFFLLKFYQQTSRLRLNNPQQAIAFCEPNNICFPFFVEYIWHAIDENSRSKMSTTLGVTDIDKISTQLNSDPHLRNWFRSIITKSLTQPVLFSLNEITALQNYSSGGELSFVRFALPHYQTMSGRMLDAGCGTGFGTLIMSQYFDVCAIDACTPRLERAKAFINLYRNLVKKEKNTLFAEMIRLIEKELGDMTVDYQFPSLDQLLTLNLKDVRFLKGGLDYLPYPDHYFTAINCLDVLEHTSAPTAIISEFTRVLMKGGRVFVTVPTLYGKIEQVYYEELAGNILPAMLHLHHFDLPTLRQLFNPKHFKEVEIVPFDFKEWDDFVKIADQSSLKDLAARLKANKIAQVPGQVFAVYEKIT